MTVRIKKEYLKTNTLASLYYVIHGAMLLVLPLLLLNQYLEIDFQNPVFILSWLLAIVISGMGLFFLGTLGHEGFHGNMGKNRSFSMFLGIFSSSIVPGYNAFGYSIYHWQHHKYENTENDPDFALFSAFGPLFGRLFRGPNFALPKYIKASLSVLSSSNSDSLKGYPFKENMMKYFSLVNLVLNISVLSVIVYCFLNYTSEAFVFILGPVLVATGFTSILPYIEHGNLNGESGRVSRSYRHWIFTILFLGLNYHREHHLYPSVQLHKLIFLAKEYDEKLNGIGAVEYRFMPIIKLALFGKLYKASDSDEIRPVLTRQEAA